MEQNNIPDIIDLNKDGIIDNKDIKLLDEALSSMDFKDKKEFVNKLNIDLNNSENKELLENIKNILENDFNVLDMKDNNLYLLYQSLFLGGDIIDKEVDNINKKYFSYDEYTKKFNNKDFLLNNSIDKNKYNKIIDEIGIDNLVYFFKNIKEDITDLIINYSKYKDKLDIKNIMNASLYTISDLDKNQFNKLKIITKYSLLNDSNRLLIFDKTVSYEDLKQIIDIANISYNGYYQLKDMGVNINDIKDIYKNNKEQVDKLADKGIDITNIVQLIKNDFPLEKYGEYLTVDNILQVNILYTRYKVGLNKLSIDEMIFFSDISSLFDDNINTSILEENKDDCLTDISNDFEFFYQLIKGFQEIFNNITLKDIIIIYFYTDHSKLGVSNLDDLLNLYKNELKKDNSLDLKTIYDIIYNKSIGKNESEEIQELDKIQVEKEQQEGLENKKVVNIELFKEKILPLLPVNITLEKTKGGLQFKGEPENIEYIKDILNLEGLNNFLEFLNKENSIINIEGKEIEIFKNIQFIKDILEYRNINSDLNGSNDFKKIIENYEKDLNEFLDIPKKKDTVFVSFQANQFMGGDNGGAFLGEKGILKEIFKNSEQIDLSIISKEKIQTPDQILRHLELILKNKKDKDVIFYIGVHGQIDGSASYGLGELPKSFFESINDLANKYPNFKVKIDSCYSGTKLDKKDIKGNIFTTSENETADSSITKILNENKNKMDYNKDGKISMKEIAFTEMLHYNSSLLGFHNFHSFIKNKDGNIRKLPGADKVLLDTKE